MGAQPLYTLSTSVSQNSTVLNSTSETFGIRNVTSSLVGSNSGEPSGARAFKINGVPVRDPRRRLLAEHLPALLSR